ncbi:MAG: Lrp/AsnC family transcriptional regulator [Lachnospiraceae bacterium]|jgi:DNA-binding Lrp family transcriptional regulator|nr:Lrp/AsnC family transcriptional regulator [Lachnospiraceae bacterium]MCI9099888.1 Lrp/AsnC family transcriptional regulator [Lachnospiraceae bacterium]MCI9358103.1 Lrp/AsnC family transcriptional regulator [Lachnospiraceae bacterium]
METLSMKILKALETNSRLTNSDLAIMMDVPEDEIRREISRLENEHIICGYHTLINWNTVSDEDVTALVELRVTPQGGDGYQKIAEKIKDFPQVVTLYLVSGAYDFLVTVKGRTLKEISLFVSGKLASLPEVQSTTTHFALSKYKELGVDLDVEKTDKRMVVTP